MNMIVVSGRDVARATCGKFVCELCRREGRPDVLIPDDDPDGREKIEVVVYNELFRGNTTKKLERGVAYCACGGIMKRKYYPPSY